MSRRILLVGSVLVLLTAIIFGIVIIRTRTHASQNPLKAIPVDASVIIRINDYQKLIVELNQHSKVWDELKKLPALNILGEGINILDSTCIYSQDLRELISGESYISFHNEGDRKIGVLYVFSPDKSFSSKEFIQLLKQIKIDVKKVQSRKYEGKEIKDVTYSVNSENEMLSFSITGGLLLVSKSSVILEDALRQLTLPVSLYDSQSFSNILQTSGKNKLANVYLNHSAFNQSFSFLFNSNFTEIIESSNVLDNWVQLDFNLDANTLLLNGFVHHTDSIISHLDILSKQNPVVFSADKVLPSSTCMLLSYGFEDGHLMYQNLLAYMTSKGTVTEYNNNLNSFNTLYKLDLITSLSEIFDGELSIANVILDDSGKDTDQLILLKVKSAGQARQEMFYILDKIARVKGVNRDVYRYKYYLDNDKKFDIYKIPVKNFAGTAFGDMFNCFDEQYFAIIGNYIVLANSQLVLSKTIHNYELNKTLSTNQVFLDFRKTISSKSNILFYAALNNSVNFFEKYLNKDIIEEWKNNPGVFDKIQSFGFQLGTVDQLPYCNISLKYHGVLKEKPHTVWQSLLDTTISFKPQFVINHYTKEKEIFIQDEKNNIYLISKAGRIIWKIPLQEKINSEIYQIDYYKNNKLQLLFSTKNYIHLLDRNGNYVERYPVKLRAPSSCGVALFDYEQSENYRFFIPCTDKKVYAYSKDGNLINGWQFNQADHIVETTPQHFRIEDKDFIIFGDKYRMYILDRRGNTRIEPEEYFPKSENNDYILEKNSTVNTSSIVTTDTAGIIYNISFDGSVEKIKIHPFSSQHFFDYKDIDGDNKKEYIFLDNNKLEVYNKEKDKIIEYKFNSSISSEPLYFHFSYTDRKLGLVSKKENKIYLINNDGNMYEGFPLTGCTPFSIGFLDNSPQFNLIVGNNDQFLLNYTVH